MKWAYHHLSPERKRAYARELAERRSPPLALEKCKRCDARVPVIQLPAHRARCPGKRKSA